MRNPSGLADWHWSKTAPATSSLPILVYSDQLSENMSLCCIKASIDFLFCSPRSSSAFLLLSPLLPPSLGSLYCQHTDLTHWTLSPCSHLKALALGVPYAWNTFSSVLPEGYLHRCAKLYFYSHHLIYPWPAFSSQHLSLDILCNHLATCLFLPPPTSMKTPWD